MYPTAATGCRLLLMLLLVDNASFLHYGHTNENWHFAGGGSGGGLVHIAFMICEMEWTRRD
jgi:hypothetical protein